MKEMKRKIIMFTINLIICMVLLGIIDFIMPNLESIKRIILIMVMSLITTIIGNELKFNPNKK